MEHCRVAPKHNVLGRFVFFNLFMAHVISSLLGRNLEPNGTSQQTKPWLEQSDRQEHDRHVIKVLNDSRAIMSVFSLQSLAHSSGFFFSSAVSITHPVSFHRRRDPLSSPPSYSSLVTSFASHLVLVSHTSRVMKPLQQGL